MRIIAILLFILIPFFAKSQTAGLSLHQYEDSLKNLGKTITNDTLESNRIQANYTFIKTLTSALKQKGSFNYNFSQLNDIISVKTSDDRKFKIFTWFVYLNNGSFRYYGAIQMNNPEKLELIPLIDGTPEIVDPENVVLPSNKWLGAVYYDIIPVSGKNPYYILLGWKGQDTETSSKIFEPLSFKGGNAFFGMPVVQNEPSDKQYLHRKIFTYNSNASILLRYLKNEKTFVFDHLVPQDSKFKDVKKQYIPDLSYDGYKFRNGKWNYVENLDLKNLPNEKDNLYVDPAKIDAGTVPIRKY